MIVTLQIRQELFLLATLPVAALAATASDRLTRVLSLVVLAGLPAEKSTLAVATVLQVTLALMEVIVAAILQFLVLFASELIVTSQQMAAAVVRGDFPRLFHRRSLLKAI